ncbi:alpha/beta hydrolase [Leptospira sp. GIMC2001]|uniref:alpha/beta hydrolase n=1 Tax=Leptospira sp. GIMC2001 TaxID=1513297 RepID=UPI00234B672C|nr:alpha/beta hydrolase [Leptospira sp. GIMC2001]WCL50212.1 alpha/beta hydrolase [Leptospira sp. GIMC2001]
MQANPLLKGIPLLGYYSGIRKNDKAQVHETEFEFSPGNRTRTLLFYPPGKDPKNLPGIFLLHGMSALGIDDVRIQNLAKNLALCGYSVACPELSEVKSLLIREVTIEKSVNLFKHFYEREDLHKPGQVGYFSASFSGALGLIALSDPKVSDLVRSSMLVGSYNSFGESLVYAVDNFEIDNYAGLIVMLNFLGYLDKKLHNEVNESVYNLALDNGLYRTGENAIGPKLIEGLSKSARDFMKQMLNDKKFRMSLIDGIREVMPNSIKRDFSPYYKLAQFKSPLSLLHGYDDPVISYKESIKIHACLRNRMHPVYLEVSNVITHGDQLPLHTQIAGVPGVTRCFGYFFSWF